MATTDDYGQGVSIASLTDAPNAETLAKNIANAITGRSVLRFASASARSAALTGVSAPVEGMVSWLQDTNFLYVYDGSAWQRVLFAATSWQNLTLSGSWVADGGTGAATPAARVTSDGLLELSGVMKGTALTAGQNAAVGFVPGSMIPSLWVRGVIPTSVAQNAARIAVEPGTGEISIVNGSVTVSSSAWFQLDGVRGRMS